MNSDRLMRNIMEGMGMGMPFGGMFADPFQQGLNRDPMSSMLPHGFMSPMSMMMMDPFQSMQQTMSMANGAGNGGFSYCSSSVTSYTTDEHGRPQVYQQSSEVKQGPNGIRETKNAIRDSKTGHQELAIGHHMNEKARIKKKSKNVYTGEEEQAEDLVNLDETEAETFEQNWMQQARNITPPSFNQLSYGPSYGRAPRTNRLALTSGQEDPYTSSHRQSYHTSAPQVDKSPMKTKKKKKSKDARV